MDHLGMLGEKIRELRKNRGWTQSRLAGASEVSERTIRRLEAGDTKPQPETLQDLSAALEIDVSELTGFLDVSGKFGKSEVLPVLTGETFLGVIADTDELSVEVDEGASVAGSSIEMLLDQIEWSEILKESSSVDQYRWGQQVNKTSRSASPSPRSASASPAPTD